MRTMKHFPIVLALLCASTVMAQSLQQETRPTPGGSQSVTVIIERQQLCFAAPASAQEVKLEVFNQAGELIYDSGFVSGAELSWALRNTSGEAIPSGLYAYTLTVREANSEAPAHRYGHLILESGHNRLWVTNQGAVGAEAAISGGELTASSGPETSVVGARIGRASAARSTLNLDFFGTPGRIPMFTGGDFLADSVIWQDFNGRIGIGTQRPGAALLTVAGQIETTSGGIKFPNGTVQTTSAAGSLFQVNHNATLTGNGTEGSPLGVAVPLRLTTSSQPVAEFTGAENTTLIVTNNGGAPTNNAISASSMSGRAIDALTEHGIAVLGRAIPPIGGGLAGLFVGNVDMTADLLIEGNLNVKGTKNFKIDHPLDPENKYLIHAAIESSEALNVYSGNARLDQNGEAVVKMPEWFQAINKDFRYSLTPIGASASGLYISEELEGNRFKIAGGAPGLKVSWQVTGVRSDEVMLKHPFRTEEVKSARERGY
ncbi:MAG TPA: hypothetical protein VJ810_13915 [Blastocatellia bacterium]|nr:hypothetical protein [Blastocatellia bacterium]